MAVAPATVTAATTMAALPTMSISAVVVAAVSVTVPVIAAAAAAPDANVDAPIGGIRRAVVTWAVITWTVRITVCWIVIAIVRVVAIARYGNAPRQHCSGADSESNLEHCSLLPPK
jgi:hypothetical protein